VAPGQCVLLADTGVFHLSAHVHNIWLDALFIRLTSPDNSTIAAVSTLNDAPRALAVSSQGSMMVATDVTLQGHGGQQAVALWVASSSIHIQGAEPFLPLQACFRAEYVRVLPSMRLLLPLCDVVFAQ
jgi:hypothetical protein